MYQVKELEDQIAQQKEASESADEILQLSTQITDLKAQLVQARRQAADLESASAAVQAELRRELQEAAAATSMQTARGESAEQKAQEASQQRDSLQSVAVQRQEELARQLEEAAGQQEAILAQLQFQKHAADASATGQAETVRQLEAEISEAQHLNTVLTSQLQEAQEREADLRSQVEAVQGQAAAAASPQLPPAAAAGEEAESSGHIIEALRSQLQAVQEAGQADKADLSSQLEGAQAAAADLKRRNRELAVSEQGMRAQLQAAISEQQASSRALRSAEDRLTAVQSRTSSQVLFLFEAGVWHQPQRPLTKIERDSETT